MAINAGKAFVELAIKGKAKAFSVLDAVKKRMRAFGGAMRKMGGALAKVAAVGAAATLAGIGVVLTKGIKAASDMQETMNKFNVVFGESAETMKNWSDATASAFGRSKEQIASAVAGYQDLLVPMGLSGTAAQSLSKDLVALGLDVASFNNRTDADVVADFQAALTGSGEVMKKYGVVLNEAAVKAELMNNGIDPKHATNAQKAMARYNIILAGTSAAHGDVARSSDSFANQLKAIKAKASDFLVVVGEKLLPILESWMADLQALFAVLAGDETIASAEGQVDAFAESIKNMESPIVLITSGIAGISGVIRTMQALLSRGTAGILRFGAAIVEAGKFIFGDDGSDQNTLRDMADAVDQTADELEAKAKVNFAAAGTDNIRKKVDEAKRDIKKDRDAAKVDLKKADKKDFEDPDYNVPAEKMKEAADKMISAANPESLDVTRDIKAFTQFQQNKTNQELRALKAIEKAIKAQKTAVGVV